MSIEGLDQNVKDNIGCVGKFIKAGNLEGQQRVSLLSESASEFLRLIKDDLVALLGTSGQNFRKSTTTDRIKVKPYTASPVS